MNSFISYNEYKKGLALNETYESYVELNQLARHIIDACVKDKTLIGKYHYLNKFTNKKFKIIKNLLDGKVPINVLSDTNKKGGGFFAPSPDDSYNDKINSPNGAIHVQGLNIGSIVHELQHAYDYIRSKGKIEHSKSWHKMLSFSQASYLDPKDVNKSYNTLYYRSPHEKSSFFVGTLSKINFFEDKKEMILKDIHDVYDEFKETYSGYEYLTPKIKKDLARKFSQYYYKIKEKNENK